MPANVAALEASTKVGKIGADETGHDFKQLFTVFADSVGMKIAPLSETLLSTAQQQGSTKIQKSFEQVRAEVGAATPLQPILGPDLSRELAQLTQGAMNGKVFTPQELLLFQVKSGQFALRVELISKMAEAGVSTLKKLQNPQ